MIRAKKTIALHASVCVQVCQEPLEVYRWMYLLWRVYRILKYPNPLPEEGSKLGKERITPGW